MVRCLICDEVFLLPKDTRVLPDDPRTALPSCVGVQRPIKLEYLPEGSDACPLVRLYDFDTTGARRLHDAFCSLASGSLQHVSLEEIVSVDSIDGCRITFTRGAQDRGVVQTAEREFDVVLSSEGWAHTAGLAEPFRDNCSSGYQWLTEHAGDIQLLFSPGGDW